MMKYLNGITVIGVVVFLIAIGISRHPIYWALPLIAASDIVRERGLFGHYVREMFRKDKTYTTKHISKNNKA